MNIQNMDRDADPYMSTTLMVERLIEEYKKHGKLIIAFDFDNTIFDFHGKGFIFPTALSLLRACGHFGFDLILFTCRDTKDLEDAEEYCRRIDIPFTHTNESPENTFRRKPYYNLLLDDRAGLGQACEILSEVLNFVRKDKQVTTVRTSIVWHKFPENPPPQAAPGILTKYLVRRELRTIEACFWSRVDKKNIWWGEWTGEQSGFKDLTDQILWWCKYPGDSGSEQ